MRILLSWTKFDENLHIEFDGKMHIGFVIDLTYNFRKKGVIFCAIFDQNLHNARIRARMYACARVNVCSHGPKMSRSCCRLVRFTRINNTIIRL